MNNLTERDRELVAIGAAIASNCIPCIEHHVPAARKAGLDTDEIKEAILLADKVKRVPARKVIESANLLLGQKDNEVAATDNKVEVSGCG